MRSFWAVESGCPVHVRRTGLRGEAGRSQWRCARVSRCRGKSGAPSRSGKCSAVIKSRSRKCCRATGLPPSTGAWKRAPIRDGGEPSGMTATPIKRADRLTNSRPHSKVFSGWTVRRMATSVEPSKPRAGDCRAGNDIRLWSTHGNQFDPAVTGVALGTGNVGLLHAGNLPPRNRHSNMATPGTCSLMPPSASPRPLALTRNSRGRSNRRARLGTLRRPRWTSFARPDEPWSLLNSRSRRQLVSRGARILQGASPATWMRL